MFLGSNCFLVIFDRFDGKSRCKGEATGAEDGTVPPEQSRQMAAALKRLGSPVQYTEFPGVGHGSWEKAYATPGIWLFYDKR